MKRLLILFTALSLSSSLFAADKVLWAPSGDWKILTTTGQKVNLNDTLYTTQDGKVGIGVPSPTLKLDVAGSVNLSTGNDYKINGITVLSSSSLGSGITSSSLTSIGTLSSLSVTGDVNSTSGSYKIGGNSVLSSSTLGSGITSSSLTSVGTLGSLTVTNNISSTSGTISGNGSGLTSLNGSNIASGTVSSSYLPAAGAAASGIVNTTTQTFAGAKTFNGNIGLGVSPTAKFTLLGDASGSTNLATSYSNAELHLQMKSDSGWFVTGGATSGDTPYFQVSAVGVSPGPLLLNPYGGSVGIGTTAPYYGLSVNSVYGINAYNGGVGLGKFVLGDPADPTGYIGMYRSASGPANVGTSGNSLGLGAYGDMTFSTGAASFAGQTERMRIQQDGKIGIGMTPTVALDVNGDISLSGIGRGNGFVPPGAIMQFAGSTAPTGWFICDGSEKNSTTYNALYVAIGSGTIWNTSTNPLTGSAQSAPAGGNFRIPNLQGTFLRSVATYAGADAYHSDNNVALAAFKVDKGQGHFHNIDRATDGRGIAHDGTTSGSAQFNLYPSTSNSSPAALDATNVFRAGAARTDSTNGTPRAGKETIPKQIGINYIIKY